jgi:hypothetical protein
MKSSLSALILAGGSGRLNEHSANDLGESADGVSLPVKDRGKKLSFEISAISEIGEGPEVRNTQEPLIRGDQNHVVSHSGSG